MVKRKMMEEHEIKNLCKRYHSSIMYNMVSQLLRQYVKNNNKDRSCGAGNDFFSLFSDLIYSTKGNIDSHHMDRDGNVNKVDSEVNGETLIQNNNNIIFNVIKNVNGTANGDAKQDIQITKTDAR